MTMDGRPAAKPPIPIDEQIAAVRRAADGKAVSLEHRVSRRKASAEGAMREIDRLEAAIATLRFCADHAADFRVWWEARRRFLAERAADLASLEEATPS